MAQTYDEFTQSHKDQNMSNLTLLVIEISISIVSSTIIMMLLSRALKAALSDLCPTEKQADFWLAYTRTMLLISPLLLVLLMSIKHSGDAFSDLRMAFIAVLTGLLFGLVIIGQKMYLPVEINEVKKSDGGKV